MLRSDPQALALFRDEIERITGGACDFMARPIDGELTGILVAVPRAHGGALTALALSSATSWGPSGAEAARRHEQALEVLLRIASREVHLARLGEEIQDTSRRINALEQVLLPALAAEAGRIEAALDERDREDSVRLKRLRAKRGRR